MTRAERLARTFEIVRVTVAWCAFVAGALFVTVDIVRLNMTGLAVLGVVLLAVWLWLIGGFRRDFWISDDPRLGMVESDVDARGSAPRNRDRH